MSSRFRALAKKVMSKKGGIPTGAITKRVSLKRVAKKVNRLTRIVGVERRWKHDYWGRGNVDSAGVSGSLSLVSQGDGDFQRSGNQLMAKFLKLRLILNNHPASTHQQWRVAIVRDMENIGAPPAPSLIWDGTILGTAIATTAYRIPTTLKRFKILYDQVFDNNPMKPERKVMINLKLNFPIQYNGAATTDYRKNAVFFYIWNNNVSGASPDEYAVGSTFTFYP